MKDANVETAQSTSAPWSSPDSATVLVISGGASGKSARLPGRPGGVLRVGKAPDNDLVLPDETVSRRHFEIARTDAGLVVRDLGSRNGTFVGGTRVREATLEPGALLAAGKTELLVRVEMDRSVVPPSAAPSFGLAYGKSLAMRRIFGVLERIAPTEATVLLTGETGVGKDVLARSIHAASARAAGPFEVIDCGAISPTLVETELFGHEKGAFTGAVGAHAGAFERAQGGTVFLDEIGELPLPLQPKLLRVLEARQIRRVGGKRPLQVDVRIVAATTRDLKAEADADRFRRDLYFRIAVVPVQVPPLRERGEDIPLLAERILTGVSPELSLSPEAVGQLRSYEWPGNVREMRNVVERAAFMAQASGERVLRALDLGGAEPVAADGDLLAFEEGVSYRDARARVEAAFERRFVAWLLARHGGNVAAAARAAHMDRKYLGDLARKHGLG